MLNQLREVFPNLIFREQHKTARRNDYAWYMTPDNEIIGIEKSVLTKRDITLLDLFLSPYSGAHPPITKRERAWFELIYEQKNGAFFDRSFDYRFIIFTLSEPLSDPNDFKEAFGGLYSKRPTIIWIDQQTGVIIEEEQLNEEEISYDEMIEVLATDFYLDVHLYIGPYLSDPLIAGEYLRWMEDSYEQLNHFSIKPVMNFINAVPYLLPTMKESNDARFLVYAILKDTVDDEELLRTIQTFLECNSNVTLAAKEMYMHRNSLQYRIDKFIEKTMIDVKQFDGAIAVYLILLLKRHLEKSD